MAIDLKRITRGKKLLPPRVLIHSFDGVGKTKFAAGSEDPFFLDLDKGSFKYDVQRATPESWTETLEYLSAVENGKIKCRSVVIDTLTQLENLGHLEFFPGTTVSEFDGGWGHGDDHVLIKWRELLGVLERIWSQNKTIVLVAHTTVRKFNDPTGPGYERFEVGLRKSLAGLLRQWSEYVFFAREEVSVVAAKNDVRKATTSGVRWAYTRRTPAYDAKARGTLLFPERFPLSWDEFTRAVASEHERSEELNASLLAMLDELGDDAIAKQAKEFVRQNPENILAAHQSIQAKLEAKRAAAVVPVQAAVVVQDGGA